MLKEEWQPLLTAKSYEEAAMLVKSQLNVCQYRHSDLKNRTKYSFKCNEYRKYPLCSYEIQIIVPDDDPTFVTVMSRNIHQHQQYERNSTTRLPSPIRKTVSKYVHCGLSQSQIKLSLIQDHPHSPIHETKLINLINYERRKNRREIFSASQKHKKIIFPQSRRLMCWSHMIRKCRLHRNLVPKDLWPSMDQDIHSLQLSFSDDIFNNGVKLFLQKWNAIPSMKNFMEYFVEQWITKLPYWYEGAVFGKPATNNGCESMNAIIKQKYTLRNKLHLSAFLPKVEQMLKNWSDKADSSPFSNNTTISSDTELQAYQWSLTVNQSDILH
ncbi:unnamed protein product [Rotaria sp. Silwood2]|nr:unnamed protein product [Rotaria sp. Silwood2]